MEPSSPNTPTPAKQKRPLTGPLIVGGIVLVLLIAAIAGVLSKGKKSNSTNSGDQPAQATAEAEKNANPVATLALDPDSGNAVENETLTVSVYVDSKDQPTNAVQANLTYPTDKFEFVSIDDKDSAFGVGAEAKGGNGKITIARGYIGTPEQKGLTGKQLIAKVNLKVIDASGSGEVKFSSDSDVISSADNKSLLSSSGSALFSLKAE